MVQSRSASFMFAVVSLLLQLCLAAHAEEAGEASSMLQQMSGLSRGRVEADEQMMDDLEKEVSAESLPAGTVNWDGFDTFEVKRKELPGFASEVLFRLPAGQVGTLESGRVFIPYKKMLSATFVRDMHGIGSYEYGIAKWIWTVNEISILGAGMVVMAAEKLHTFAHEGAWSTDSLDAAREVQRTRRETTNMIAESARFSRSAAANLWVIANNVGGQLVNASMDMKIMEDVMAFAAEPESDAPSAVSQRMAAVSANMTKKHQDYVERLAQNGGSPSASSTAVNCFHLHGWPGAELTADGFWLPLGKKLVSVRGQVVFSPLQHFSLTAGITMASYNADTNSIDIYQGAASMANFVNPTLNQPATLFVGPADGASRPIPPESRYRPDPYSNMGAAVAKGLYKILQMVPEESVDMVAFGFNDRGCAWLRTTRTSRWIPRLPALSPSSTTSSVNLPTWTCERCCQEARPP
mmetsp:Transcript_28677/g.92231  ORF Transcript_28677/g.92231 Transcript_28677/m.92231 type:complete len:466 (-) Transcript_28677:34-1431(-)